MVPLAQTARSVPIVRAEQAHARAMDATLYSIKPFDDDGSRVLPGLEAPPRPVTGLDLGFMPGRHLGDGAAVLETQGLEHGRFGVPLKSVETPDVLGKQVVVHHPRILGSESPHDVVVIEVLEPGPVPRLAVFPVAGALGPDHVRRHLQRDSPVGRSLALGELRVAVLDRDVIAEEACPLAAGVRDQGFLLVQFQPEGLPEEHGQLRLDLLGFGLRPDKSQYVVICVPYVLQAAITGIHRVAVRERAQLPREVPDCRPVPAPPCACQRVRRRGVLRIRRAARSPRVLRDQFPLDELVELVEVDVTEDRGHRAALRTAAERFPVIPFFEIPGFEHVPHQPEKPLVLDLLTQYVQENLVPQRPEAVADVSLNEPHGPGPGVVDLPQRGMTPSVPPEPVRPVGELRLVVRLKEQADHLADQLVRPRGQPEGAELAIPLGNVDAAGRGEPVPLVPHQPDDLVDLVLGHAVGGFLCRPGRHRPLVGVDVPVGGQVQIPVAHLPVKLRERQALPAALAENAKYHCGFLHFACLMAPYRPVACAPSPCGPAWTIRSATFSACCGPRWTVRFPA